MKPSKPNRFDLIPAALIVLFAVLAVVISGRLIGGNGGPLFVEICCSGDACGTYVLSSVPEDGKRLTLENNGETLEVLLEKDGVTVLSSTCSGHDCVNTGKITRPGRSIVCLPGRIVITLCGGTAGQDEIDIYAG